MVNKYEARARRSRRARAHIRNLGAVRLSVHRTPRHIYAQLIDAKGERTLATASTVEQDVRKGLKSTGNIEAAVTVGKLIAERAKAAGVEVGALLGWMALRDASTTFPHGEASSRVVHDEPTL